MNLMYAKYVSSLNLYPRPLSFSVAQADLKLPIFLSGPELTARLCFLIAKIVGCPVVFFSRQCLTMVLNRF